MTELTRVVRRETPAFVRNRALVIELHPWGVRVKEKGRRSGYDVPYRAIFEQGAKLKANDIRRAKAEERAAKKKAKGAIGRG